MLSSCRGDSAKEIQTCKAPDRLTLRELEEGENPDAAAARAPETPAAANLAGRVDQRINLNEKAQEHYNAALQKLNAGDGRGCIAELDKSDVADPRPNMVSAAASWGAGTRAQCLMLSGGAPPARCSCARCKRPTCPPAPGPRSST